MSSIYQINKGVNKPIEFKGLKAQYIWYLAAGILMLMIVYAFMFILGINQYLCLVIILGLGTLLVYKVYGLSNKYGQYGMMKMLARKAVPKRIRCNSRRIFVETLRRTGTRK